YVTQGVAPAAMVWLVYLVWRRRYAYDVQAATLVVAGLLATPYLYDYDLPVLGVALAFWARRAIATGWRPWEQTAIFTAWAIPLVMRAVAVTTHVSALPLILVGTVTLLLSRAVSMADQDALDAAVDVGSPPPCMDAAWVARPSSPPTTMVSSQPGT